MLSHRFFTARLTLALLLAYGALVGLLGRHVVAEHEQEALQRLSHGLARHIVERWPEITQTDPDQADRGVPVLQVVVVHWGPAQSIFDTVDLSLRNWGLGVAASVLFFDEGRKTLGKRFHTHNSGR